MNNFSFEDIHSKQSGISARRAQGKHEEHTFCVCNECESKRNNAENLSAKSVIEINPKNKPTHSIIWLHGLGADGFDLTGLIPALQLPETLNLRHIFPHAPIRPVSFAGGTKMRAWFNIANLSQKSLQNLEGLNDAKEILEKLIANEIKKGIPSEHVFLAGFSQGGALALYTGLLYPHKLAGIIALSSFLPSLQKIEKEKSTVNQGIPIFQAHGKSDPLIPISFAQSVCDYLINLGYKVEWKVYNMAHEISALEIADIAKWLCSILSL